MQFTRPIFDTALGKILMPWVTLGFGAALLALATEVLEIVRDLVWLPDPHLKFGNASLWDAFLLQKRRT